MRPLNILIFTLFCGGILPAFAQDFKDGFIVDSNKNFVYGYISFTQTPHRNCIFKEQKDGSPITYTTGQIEGYGVINGNHFRKKPIENFEGSAYPEDIFMEAVVDGPVILYVVLDRMFIERSSSFYEIKIEKDKEKQKTYRSTITSLLGDCGSSGKKAKNIPITIFSVKTLVQEYNACAASGGQTTEYARSWRELGVMAGFDRMKFMIEGSPAISLERKNFTDRTLASGGIHYKFSPKWSQHFSLVSGLWFNEQRLYLSEKSGANGSNRVNTLRINYQVMRFPILIEAGNFSTSRIQPYLKAGLSLPFMLNRNLTMSSEEENNNIVYIDQYAVNQEFKEPLFLHVIAGASFPVGEKFRGFLEASYSKGSNEFRLETPKNVKGKFSNTGLNIGLARFF